MLNVKLTLSGELGGIKVDKRFKILSKKQGMNITRTRKTEENIQIKIKNIEGLFF